MSNKPAVASPLAEPGVDELGEAEPIRIEMDKRVEFAILLGMVALGAAIIYLASSFRIGSFPDPVTTRGLSYVTGGYLIVAGLYLSIRRLLTWPAIPGKYTLSEGNEDERNHPASSLRAFTIMGLAILWAVSVTPIGFLIVTPVVLMGVVWMMGVRAPGKLIGFPLIFTLATWLVFSQLLGIRLPYGFTTGLARSWGLIY